MMIPSYEQPIAPNVLEQIMLRLEAIEKNYAVKILFAIESGSRAWGFPSPDSDYDVRFVYVNQIDWYLSIFPGRDVIEQPIEEELDINGWDLKKALTLLIKPNPVLLEWLSSPTRYIWNSEACDKLTRLADEITHAKACLYHYLNLGKRQWKAYIEDQKEVNLKKYLYVVRPAMAIRWIRLNPTQLPPMNFFELREKINLPENLSAELDEILIKKSQTKELGSGKAIPEINKFIIDEFNWAQEAVHSTENAQTVRVDKVDKLFLELVKTSHVNLEKS